MLMAVNEKLFGHIPVTFYECDFNLKERHCSRFEQSENNFEFWDNIVAFDETEQVVDFALDRDMLVLVAQKAGDARQVLYGIDYSLKMTEELEVNFDLFFRDVESQKIYKSHFVFHFIDLNGYLNVYNKSSKGFKTSPSKVKDNLVLVIDDFRYLFYESIAYKIHLFSVDDAHRDVCVTFPMDSPLKHTLVYRLSDISKILYVKKVLENEDGLILGELPLNLGHQVKKKKPSANLQ